LATSLTDLVRRSPLYKFAKSVQERSPERTAARRNRTRFYRQFVSEGDLVFDIGANVGNRVETFLNLGARVVAVEPQELCVKLLKTRFGSNPSLIIIPYGLDAVPGVQSLYVADRHVLSSMSPDMIERPVLPGTVWALPVEVPVTTFDALIETFGSPDFAKIDVEGFEYQVIAGLVRPVRQLSLEFYPSANATAIACLNRLDGLANYEYAFSVGESMTLGSGWLPTSQIRLLLEESPWGDIYARLADPG
jgi:FkbM family methyltransferase